MPMSSTPMRQLRPGVCDKNLLSPFTASPKFHDIAHGCWDRFGPENPEKCGKIFDMRAKAHCALWTAGLLLVVPVTALTQDAPQTVDDNSALVPEAPLTPEESAMLGNALLFDPEALATPPKKPLRLPGVSDKDFDITRTEKPDGSSTIVVKQPLQTDWSNS